MSDDYTRGYDAGMRAGEGQRHSLERHNIQLVEEVKSLREQLSRARRDASLFTEREIAERRRQWGMVSM
jgi:hypothetical protein